MSATVQEHLAEFMRQVDLAIRVHNIAREATPVLGSPEGHLINENTLVRIDDAAPSSAGNIDVQR